MLRAALLICLAYVVALAAALLTGSLLAGQHPIVVAGVADVAATLVVFGFSRALDNSSVYDAYWSVAPVPLAIYAATLAPQGALGVRHGLVLVLVGIWAARLTWNWARGWEGLHHEDWRYVDLRQKTGRLYWPASLVGLHLMPTLMVFLGCLSLFVVLPAEAAPLGILDVVAAVVTFAGIGLETVADAQLRAGVASGAFAGRSFDRGLWAWSRHPNYLGEVTFWWGLFLFALAARPSAWWTVAGPVAITGLFLGISIPMMERRMLVRRADFAERMRRVSVLLLWPPRQG
jgi:steroid 5-alpha reductase family enzyme